jgi:hypothetical protein
LDDEIHIAEKDFLYHQKTEKGQEVPGADPQLQRIRRRRRIQQLRRPILQRMEQGEDKRQNQITAAPDFYNSLK